MSAVEHARQVVLDAIEQRMFPGAVGRRRLESTARCGTKPSARATFAPLPLAPHSPRRRRRRSIWRRSPKSSPPRPSSWTWSAAGVVRLDDRIAESFPEWRGADREAVTVQDLLEHASGLPARLLEAPPSTRREFEHDICTMPLAYTPRTAVHLLGSRLHPPGHAGRSSRRSTRWTQQFDAIRARLGVAESLLAAGPADVQIVRCDEGARRADMPQDDDVRRGRMLAGEVHDNYAAALGGVAGHAGLFGTAAAVAAFARLVLRAARGGAVPPPLSSVVRGEVYHEERGRRAAPARSGGTRCCRPRRAEPGCRRPPSATSASPERRSGSIRLGIATSCCSPTASADGGTLDRDAGRSPIVSRRARRTVT